MKLSRLEIYGFKSFAKKLDLRLMGGITSVVGPNGCGKTNVVDAIRWVLGEQRPSRIRLDAMEDVIFKGSGTRRPLGMAEVSLTIENASGILPANLPEVTITRRLFRSGESEYMINRRQCRLSDINDLFMDTGMGSDSYSVFEHTMINAILSDKAEDRRHIFEETAGITRYKARRKSALNTLVSIDGDLERLNDIISELERRVSSLKRQAGKAARYRALKSELKERMIALGAFEIAGQRRKIEDVETAFAGIVGKKEAMARDTETVAGAIDSLSVDMVKIEKEMADTAGRYESAVRTMSEKESELARCESRLESLEEIARRARESASSNVKSLEKMADEHGRCAAELETAEKRLCVVDQRFAETSEHYRAFNSRMAEATSVYNRLEQDHRKLEREITLGESTLKQNNARREENERRIKDIATRLNDIKSAMKEFDRNIASLRRRHDEASVRRDALLEQRDDLKTDMAGRMEELAGLEQELLGEKERRMSVKAEADFLSELMQSYAGYLEGVKNAVQSPVLEGHVEGVLADIVSAERTYEKAVAAALEDSLQHIIVDSSGAARDGVQWLSEHGKGTASFFPLESGAPDAPPRDIPDDDSIIGAAVDFARSEERFMPVLRRYLSDVLIVDTLDSAIRLHERYNTFLYVTPDGETVGRRGEVSGGREPSDSEKEMVSIGRQERLCVLVESLTVSDMAIAKLEEKRKERGEQIAALRGSIAECERQLESCNNELSSLSSESAREKAKHDAAQDTYRSLEAESEKISQSFSGSDNEITELTERIGRIRAAVNEIEKQRDNASKAISELTEERDSIREEMNACEVERARLREKKASLAHEMDSISERRETLARASKRFQREIEEAEAENLQLGDRKKAIVEDLESLAKDHEALEKRKIEMERTYSELRTFRSGKEQHLQKLRSELADLTSRESSLKLQRDEAAMIMNGIVQRITEEYFIDPDEIPSAHDDPSFKPEQEKNELAELRRKIHMIGDVNLAAEADYNTEKERLDYFAGERDDLVQARDDLYETISTINQIAVDRFLETFERIKVNFQKTFKEFFGGGYCDLYMEDGTDPLETVIRISARPPGKNVRSISLLSSGERALTAISLLFALYMVKPSPFCILDEVDAPLDDSNLDQFLKVIKRFSENTQFIMVTHNKKTMAQADNLYGITMEEPGLSSLVSVRLSEVDSYRQEGAAGGGQTDNAAVGV